MAEVRLPVYSTASDTEPPKLGSLQLSAPRIKRGESVEVIADVWDDQSGVARVIAYLRNPAGTGTVHVALRGDGSSSHHRGRVAIPAGAQIGTWRLDRLQLRDRCSNETSLKWGQDPILRDLLLEVY